MAVPKPRLVCAGICLALTFVPAVFGQTAIDLAGPWRFAADPADAGIAGRWYDQSLAGTIRLPGSMAGNRLGDDIAPNSPWTGSIVNRAWLEDPASAPYLVPGKVKLPFWLNPVKIYVGAAWYQRDVSIPELWNGRRVTLFLERCHWETRVWVDGKDMGTQNSLSTPHVYDLSKSLTPGSHTLTLRIDNRIKDIDVGINAHSISDHTQTNWNGAVGRLALESEAAVFIDEIRVDPDFSAQTVRLFVRLRNHAGTPARGTIEVSARTVTGLLHRVGPASTPYAVCGGEEQPLEIVYALGPKAPLWDEFDPSLFELLAEVKGEAGQRLGSRRILFGFRDFRIDGTRFMNNGRPVFLRGTVECAVFPGTGYPAMRKSEWIRIFRTLKEYGLNHMRFHSWCPPEAAFEAADEAGVFLNVECAAWAEIGGGAPIDRWLEEESGRIVRTYGHHPSFVMMSSGNEPAGDKSGEYLAAFVSRWKARDPRRLYTSAAGWPSIPENEFHITAEPRLRQWGDGLKSRLNRFPPETMFDFRDIIAKYKVPVVAHETGQWCAYPNFQEIPRYNGPLRAGNFEIFRDRLNASGLLNLADSLFVASGRLQVLCYKAEIEAALRTPGFAGFQLLSLNDFPGQGTAPVGVVDAFWQPKPYVTAREFREFCGPTVPLIRVPKFAYTSDETLVAAVEAAHFDRFPIPGIEPAWALGDARGKTVAEGKLDRLIVPYGNNIPLGEIEIPLSNLEAPGVYTLAVRLGTAVNSWTFRVFSPVLGGTAAAGVRVVRELDADTAEFLQNGGRAILTAAPGSVRPEKGGSVAVGFPGIFWNTSWTRNDPPHTLGIFCDPKHPALARFPTDFWSDYIWWDAMTHAQAILLSDFGANLEPIVRIVDDWTAARPLGLIFEVRVGKGRLIVTGIDLLGGAENRLEARQLLHSLKAYASTAGATPKAEASVETIRGLFR